MSTRLRRVRQLSLGSFQENLGDRHATTHACGERPERERQVPVRKRWPQSSVDVRCQRERCFGVVRTPPSIHNAGRRFLSPHGWAPSGDMGKVADTFNEIVAANQRIARQLERVGQVVGRDGRTRLRVRFGLSMALGRNGMLGQFADRRAAVADDGSHARDRGCRQGDLLRTVALT